MQAHPGVAPLERASLASDPRLCTLIDLRDRVREVDPAPQPPPAALVLGPVPGQQSRREQQQRAVNVVNVLAAVGPRGNDLAVASAFPRLWRVVPQAWRAAATDAWPARRGAAAPAVEQAGTPEGAVWRVLLGWGWEVPGVAPPDLPALPPPPPQQPRQQQDAGGGRRRGRRRRPPLLSQYVSLLGDNVTVKALTLILTPSLVAARRSRHLAFAEDANAPDGQAGEGAHMLREGLEDLPLLRASISSLWRLPCENRLKEVFWRVALNGVPGAGGVDLCFSGHCTCGGGLVDPDDRDTEEACVLRGARLQRAHAFWDCPTAKAVVGAVEAALPPGTHLSRRHLWLAVPPCEAIRMAVWRVVCIAALGAMDKGRRFRWYLHYRGLEEEQGEDAGERPLRQLTLWEAWGIDPPAGALAFLQELRGEGHPEEGPGDPDLRAQRCAVQDFWQRLQAFVSGLPPVAPPRHGQRRAGGHPKWKGSGEVGVDHAFIRLLAGQPPDGATQFEVALPPQAALHVLANRVPGGAGGSA